MSSLVPTLVVAAFLPGAEIAMAARVAPDTVEEADAVEETDADAETEAAAETETAAEAGTEAAVGTEADAATGTASGPEPVDTAESDAETASDVHVKADAAEPDAALAGETHAVARAAEPPARTASEPVALARYERVDERERLLLDGTVVLGVLTTLGTAAAVTGLVFIGTAADDPPYCGDIETPSCEGQVQRRIGRWLLIPGALVAVPSGIGLGFVAHRLHEHRAAKREVQAHVGVGSMTLRF